MKRILLILCTILLVIPTLSAQDISIQLAVVTQALNQETLMRLRCDEDEIDGILALQEQFRLMKEQTSMEMNLIKARLALKLHNGEGNNEEVYALLEEASRLRLEEEKTQVGTYQQIREQLGEQKWNKLMRQIRTQERKRLEEEQDAVAARTRTQDQNNSSGSGSSRSSGSSGSSNSGSSGNSGGSGSSNSR